MKMENRGRTWGTPAVKGGQGGRKHRSPRVPVFSLTPKAMALGSGALGG